MTTVRKQKAGDQLTVGDWLAPGELLDGAAEVLFAHAYPASADCSRDDDGTHVQLVVRQQGALTTSADIVSGYALFDLATDEDLAELREAAERAQKIADFRTFADFLEHNTWAPVPDSLTAYVHLYGADKIVTVEATAEKLGKKVNYKPVDRTDVDAEIGGVSYSVIAWHKDGRPAEPKPDLDIDPDSSMEAHYDAEAEAGILSRARRQELLWKRDVGTFGSLTAALADAHAWALLEDNDRATREVERYMTSQDAGRVANLNLAHFLAVREDRRRSKPLVSNETIAEAAAMEERDRIAGGPPWEVADHPENSQPGGWHRGQIR